MRQSLLARYDHFRPLLVPVGSDFALFIGQARDLDGRDYPYADLNHRGYNVVLKNLGPGPAIDIRGVIYGPVPMSGDYPSHHFFRYGEPMLSGDTKEESSEQGVVIIPGDATIGGERHYTLYAPPIPSPGETMIAGTPIMVARLVVTYRDTFNRKHATIFDYSLDQEWRAVDGGFLPDIPKTIEELDREERAKGAAVQAAYREQMGIDRLFPNRRAATD